jgi:hypothetical protein
VRSEKDFGLSPSTGLYDGENTRGNSLSGTLAIGLFQNDVLGLLVIPPTKERRLAQLLIVRPFRKRYFAD